MPRGVYDRSKSKNAKASTSTGTGTASKVKRTFKKAAASAASHVSSAPADFTSFKALSDYLQQITQARHNISSSQELDQEIKATVSNLRNLREQLFAVTTEQVIADQKPAQTAAGIAAPVPFNPPAYTGQVQQS
jgi:hypothetical protein